MRCEDFLYLIEDLLEAELDERTASQLSTHLFMCRECTVKYELLQKEREIYRHYWFDLEPSDDLLVDFQAKLKTNRKSSGLVAEGHRSLKISNLFRLHPSATMAGILIFFVIIFAVFKNAVNKSESFGTIDTVEVNKSKPAVLTADNIRPSEISQEEDKSKSLVRIPAHLNKPVVNIKINSKTALSNKSKGSEEQLQRLKLKNLETETARQVEKVELFLRSFRNTELGEDDETYDISYEKKQARKLLERNIRLKQNAKNTGNAYPAELLNKIEPLLIEIANLESMASVQKVSEIKERLRNQNLIVSLQAFEN